MALQPLHEESAAREKEGWLTAAELQDDEEDVSLARRRAS